MWKVWHQIDHKKGHYLQYESRNNKVGSLPWPGSGRIHQTTELFYSSSHLLVNKHKIAASINFQVTNKWVGKFVNTESVNNENQLFSS
jgi:hypothetical protein